MRYKAKFVSNYDFFKISIAQHYKDKDFSHHLSSHLYPDIPFLIRADFVRIYPIIFLWIVVIERASRHTSPSSSRITPVMGNGSTPSSLLPNRNSLSFALSAISRRRNMLVSSSTVISQRFDSPILAGKTRAKLAFFHSIFQFIRKSLSLQSKLYVTALGWITRMLTNIKPCKNV